MKKTIIITITILVITIIVLGYKLNTSNNNNKALSAVIENKKFTLDLMSATESDLTSCNTNADKSYSDNWDGQCALLGKDKDCGLTNSQADSLNQNKKDIKDNCLEVYKIRMATFK